MINHIISKRESYSHEKVHGLNNRQMAAIRFRILAINVNISGITLLVTLQDIEKKNIIHSIHTQKWENYPLR